MIRLLRKFWGEEPHGEQFSHECSLNLINAVVCGDPTCHTIQKERFSKRCLVCGKEKLVSLWTIFRVAADATRAQQPRVSKPTQEAQSLTEFRVKDA